MLELSSRRIKESNPVRFNIQEPLHFVIYKIPFDGITPHQVPWV